MDPISRECLNKFYDSNLSLFGDRPEALRWSAEGQRRRFELMLREAGPLDGASVLDYGCGKGDLLGHLLRKGISPVYTGMDINPSLIKLASSKFPLARFEVRDIEDEPPEEDYDYIFICGVFNNKIEDADSVMRNVVSILYRHTRLALIFNALSSRTNQGEPDIHLTDPVATLAFIRSELTERATAIEEDIPGDVLYVLKGHAA